MKPTNDRAQLAVDQELGIGNVLTSLAGRGIGLDRPTLTFDTDVDGHPAWQALTLHELDQRVAARAAALNALDIAPRDCVAVYVSTGADMVLSYLALARIGAIPALINARVPGATAVEYIRRLRATGVLTDAAHRAELAPHGLETPLLADVSELGGGNPAEAPPVYRHHADEPVVITHSSGTTGLPKAVAHSHHSLFAAIRHRLTLPKGQGLDRMLAALPTAHAAMVIAVNLALCNRVQLAVLSEQSGTTVLEAVERWKPQSVLGFAATWSELAGEDLSQWDLDSISVWWNTGDCAHEAHIRRLVAVGSRMSLTPTGIARTKGSHFVDGLGSTEMGHSQFFITHTPTTDRYGRCIGRPHAFSTVAVLDDDCEPLGPGEVGQLGISAPTLSLGYWNDSTTTYRTRRNGFFLTGDLVHRDEDGWFYHVDRAVDAVELPDGRRLFTAMSEERVLADCGDVLECTVLAVREADRVTTTVLLILADKADREADRTAEVLAALEDHVAATVDRVVVVDPELIPLGPTGKVRKVLLRERFLAGEQVGTGQPRTGDGTVSAS
ncbi:class I adenylate-forming enzyme family protein [Streptomyces sp. W16]|uniref:class I adenylate-forming enzyme family protein n=1 Tax=Streptomyces sp. W16 TaxID=3076631 RepID=UPI00295B2B34|nr:class I adenylate-forming enzyme family protein [Streptomyces sp. W16]MDV9175753.1 class I adenylate-forming enzyme family protein [Streptomyces sp. W16]